jgi:hypothetical protein
MKCATLETSQLFETIAIQIEDGSTVASLKPSIVKGGMRVGRSGLQAAWHLTNGPSA